MDTKRRALSATQMLALAYVRINGDGIYRPVIDMDDSGEISQGGGVTESTIKILEAEGLVTVERRLAYSSIGSRKDRYNNRFTRRMTPTWDAKITDLGREVISARYTIEECEQLVRDSLKKPTKKG